MSRVAYSAQNLMVANVVKCANFLPCSAAIERKFGLPVCHVIALVDEMQTSPLPCEWRK